MRAGHAVVAVLAACVFATTHGREGKPATDEDEVVAVVFFHRHGDRSPYFEMPNDAENNRKWGSGPGMLTEKGMLQLERLGAVFRDRYLLGKPYSVASPSYQRGEYFARSTDMDRTIESAMSFQSGLYPDGAGVLNNKARPIPVHTMPLELDSLLLAFQGYQCPRFLELVHETTLSDEWVAKSNQSAAIREKAAIYSGYEPWTLTLRNISVVADPLFCESAHGMPLLPAFRRDPVLVAALFALEDFTLRPLYARTAEMRKLAGGNMLAQVISRFQKRAGAKVTVPVFPTGDTPYLEDGTKSDTVRISHFSAHDTTLVSLLGALGAFDDVNPPYASSVVFELVRRGGAFFVRTFYNKGPDHAFEQAPLRLCGGSADLCPLKTFADTFSRVVAPDFAAACKARGPGMVANETRSGDAPPRPLHATHAKSDGAGLYGAIGVLSTLLVMLVLCACGRHRAPADGDTFASVLSKYDSVPIRHRNDSAQGAYLADRA